MARFGQEKKTKYQLPPDEVLEGKSGAELRDIFMGRVFKPAMEEIMQREPRIQVLYLGFAQYWDDEANDAVHYYMQAGGDRNLSWEEAFDEKKNPLFADPDWEKMRKLKEAGKQFWDDTYDLTKGVVNELFGYLYYDNGEFIPAFACYTHEGGNQNNNTDGNYSPYIKAVRQEDGTITFSDVFEMQRPHLDGVRPE